MYTHRRAEEKWQTQRQMYRDGGIKTVTKDRSNKQACGKGTGAFSNGQGQSKVTNI